jgi:SET domain-containing protein
MSSRSFRIGRSVTGLGLFATKPIKRGVYIATYRGRRISTEEADRREARGARYMFELNTRWTIDGSPRWNVARYINHSCRPNAKPVGRRGGIVIVALRRIEPGEEITYDYGREYLDYFLQAGSCRCAACRKRAALRRRKTRLRRVVAR